MYVCMFFLCICVKYICMSPMFSVKFIQSQKWNIRTQTFTHVHLHFPSHTQAKVLHVFIHEYLCMYDVCMYVCVYVCHHYGSLAKLGAQVEHANLVRMCAIYLYVCSYNTYTQHVFTWANSQHTHPNMHTCIHKCLRVWAGDQHIRSKFTYAHVNCT